MSKLLQESGLFHYLNNKVKSLNHSFLVTELDVGHLTTLVNRELSEEEDSVGKQEI